MNPSSNRHTLFHADILPFVRQQLQPKEEKALGHTCKRGQKRVNTDLNEAIKASNLKRQILVKKTFSKAKKIKKAFNRCNVIHKNIAKQFTTLKRYAEITNYSRITIKFILTLLHQNLIHLIIKNKLVKGGLDDSKKLCSIETTKEILVKILNRLSFESCGDENFEKIVEIIDNLKALSLETAIHIMGIICSKNQAILDSNTKSNFIEFSKQYLAAENYLECLGACKIYLILNNFSLEATDLVFPRLDKILSKLAKLEKTSRRNKDEAFYPFEMALAVIFEPDEEKMKGCYDVIHFIISGTRNNGRKLMCMEEYFLKKFEKMCSKE